ncbi:Ig-like domain-containing protein [Caloramator sp. Dgby_cultured_2]|uniref:Ig-like domain-containing protein n=1 Tax=Caloramator sp. Dgby_cultured_2 TaxID=3029174 RepID=UPI00237DD308|nr:Ig-like domain-containing protein [Caloramator sp. Dgby_cultured_2]WDU82662.1 Ig-like domain-containing protein [Caloramator sp. Dgby_cultured_2]
MKLEAKVDTLEIKAESKVELVNAEVKTLVASSKGEVLTNKETKIEKIEGSKKDEVKVSGEGQLASKDKDSKEDNQSSGGSTGGTTGGSSGGSTGGTTGGTPVIIPVSSIDFDEIGVVLNKNDELNLNCIVQPLTATDKRITWDSDNIDVISVSNGKVNAKAVGEATITAKTLDQKVKKSLKIKVVDSGISLIVKKESGKISFLVKSAYDNDIITMKVLQDGNIKYIDQIQAGKNYSKVSTMLDKGKYTVYVKGLNSDIISIEFEY